MSSRLNGILKWINQSHLFDPILLPHRTVTELRLAYHCQVSPNSVILVSTLAALSGIQTEHSMWNGEAYLNQYR